MCILGYGWVGCRLGVIIIYLLRFRRKKIIVSHKYAFWNPITEFKHFISILLKIIKIVFKLL